MYRTWTATSAVSSSVTVVATGLATKLGFLTQPSNTTSGTAFAVQPVVSVRDAGGNLVQTSTALITLTLTTPGGATLTCSISTSRIAVAGVAAFSGCAVNTAGSYTLTATSPLLTSAMSTTFTVAGPAARLAFTASPSNSTGGTVFATQPVVVVQDSAGRTVTNNTSPVALSITTPKETVLTCTANPQNANSGIATFAGCNIKKKGTYTRTASSGTLTSAVSSSFTIAAGAATSLAFTTNPSGSTGGTPFSTQPAVTVQDSVGNTVNGSNPVTLSITTPAGAVLSCTANPKNSSSRVANFAGCKIDKPGTYSLTATAIGLVSAVSTSFIST